MTPEEFRKICAEYDAAPDDHAWDEGHPIFQLAQENDSLRAENESLRGTLEAVNGMVGRSAPDVKTYSGT